MLRFDELPKLNSERWLSLEDLPGEVWKRYDERYSFSNLGRGKSVMTKGNIWHKAGEFILKCFVSGNGYVKCNIYGKQFYIHRVIASLFLRNEEKLPQVDHINTNRQDNRVINLRWVTVRDNHHNPITEGNYAGASLYFCKPVVMLDEYGRYEKEFCSATEAAKELNVFRTQISALLRKADRSQVVKGHQFIFKDIYDPRKDYSLLIPPYKQYTHTSIYTVAVLNDNHIVDVFKNVEEASKKTDCKATPSQICNLCYYNKIGKRTYTWIPPLLGGNPFYVKNLEPEMQDLAMDLLKAKLEL